MSKKNKKNVQLLLIELEREKKLNKGIVQGLNNELNQDGYDFQVQLIVHGYPSYAMYFEIQNIADLPVLINKSNTVLGFSKENKVQVDRQKQPLRFNFFSCLGA